MRVVGLLLGLAGLLAPRGAGAATADGTLITNVASATFSIASNTATYKVSYCATSVVLVINPAVMLAKSANPTTQSSGGTITYTLWVTSIECSASAFNVAVVDRLPDNVMYSDNLTVWAGAMGGALWTNAYSSDNVTYTAGQPVTGQGAPYYLRWQLNWLGTCKSAFVSYTVTVL